MEKLREANVALVTRLPYFVLARRRRKIVSIIQCLNPLHIEVVYVVDTIAMGRGRQSSGVGYEVTQIQASGKLYGCYPSVSFPSCFSP